MEPKSPCRRRFILLTLVIAISLVLAIGILPRFFSGEVSSRAKIRNVLLISIDTCRADFLSCYGYSRETTPHIDAVAREGVLFENAVSPAPITRPAHSSMLTGTIPPYHGVRDNLEYRLAPYNETLAEILKNKGLTTGAIVSAFVMDSRFGVDQGFDTYHDDIIPQEGNVPGDSERIGGQTSRLAAEWLDEHKSERFFLFLHYFDPHAYYTPPEPFASRFADHPYAGEIAYTDHCIGQVVKKLKELGLYDATLIIITSDHGEMLGEHGEHTHSYFIYQSAIKVPLIFKLPQERQSRRKKALVGLIDIVPTICSLLSIKPPSQVQGIDLSGQFGEDDGSTDQRALYCESLAPATYYDGNALLGVMTDRWKYIQTTRPELYDLAHDPHESNNLAKQKVGQARSLDGTLRQILSEQTRHGEEESRQELQEEARRRLESLGYVGGGSSSEPLDLDPSKEDPKDLIDFHNSNISVLHLIHEKRYAEAERLCESLLQQRPEFFVGYVQMAQIASAQDDPAGAIAPLRRALKIKPDDPVVHVKLGNALRSQGQLDQAISHYHQALKTAPESPLAHINLGIALESQGRLDEAIDHYRKALQSNVEYVEAHNHLAAVLSVKGQRDEALEHFQKAFHLRPDSAVPLNGMAWILATHPQPEARDPSQAVRFAERAAESTQHRDPAILDTLAVAYAAAGQFDRALATAGKAISLASAMDADDLANEIRVRLELYRLAKPYREPVHGQVEIRFQRSIDSASPTP